MSNKFFVISGICLILTACGGGGSSSNSGGSTPIPPYSPTKATPTPAPTSGNFAHILISQGSNGICNGSINLPCVTVTICDPTNTSCDTVDNVLLDTGSYGLRVFSSVLPNSYSSLPQMTTTGGDEIAECVRYADNTSNWGPVKYAIVSLNGTSTTESIPIQIIDATFPGSSSAGCDGAESSPAGFGLNGIIGVGPLADDSIVSPYYACSGNTCNAVSSPPAVVVNPITKFPAGSNNGLTLTFGSVGLSGVYDADGYAIFGVGSNTSNTPPAGTGYGIFAIGTGAIFPINLSTEFHSLIYSSFLDTGSNLLFFSTSSWTGCTGYYSGLFCPTDNTGETATMIGTDGQGIPVIAKINFNMGNAETLLNIGNTTYSNIGALFPLSGTAIIDWGLPFYLGRTVYTVFSGESAVINGVNLPTSSQGYWIY